MVSIEDLKREVGIRRSLSELPDEFEATVVDYRLDTDRRGRKAFFLVVKLDDGATVTQKYTAMHLQDFIMALGRIKDIKTIDELKGKKLKFVRKEYRMGMPRWLPQPI